MVLGQSVIWFILCQRSIGGHHSLRKYWLYCSRYWRNKKMTRLHRLRYLSSKNWNGYIVLVTCPQKIETIITLILLPLLFLNWLNVMGTLFLILEKSEGFCFFVTNISVIVFFCIFGVPFVTYELGKFPLSHWRPYIPSVTFFIYD
jgi:hypothetical protein